MYDFGNVVLYSFKNHERPVMLNRLNIARTILIATFFCANALAQEEAPKSVKLFKDDSVMNVTLRGPWRSMTKRKANAKTWPGTLEYTDSNGVQQSLNVGLTTRGLTRLTKVCDFPPIKVWFDKEEVKGTAFRGQGSLKMVTHCKSSKTYQQYYILEFLSYRIYNLVSDYSFKVRPMVINYLDSERDSKPLERFGFFIEDIDDVASRNDLQELEIPKVSYKRLDPVETSKYALFQYMISNLDWSATGGRDPVECCHNTKLIAESPDANPVYAIPYDLDSSGLVNAPYAAPPSQLRVSTVRQRLYRGFCFHNEELITSMELFREKKPEIMALFSSIELLGPKSRSNATKYLEGFYKTLASPADISKLVSKCRG
jgi:hypothetical protein